MEINNANTQISEATALRICARTTPCPESCPRYVCNFSGEECARRLMESSADLIERLHTEKAAKDAEIARLKGELAAERKKFAKLYGNYQSGMSTKMIPCPICGGTASIRLSQRHDAPELFNLMCGECYGHTTIQLFTDAPTGAESE